MNETTIKPISSVRPPESGIASKSLTPVQAEAAPAYKPTVSEPDTTVKPVETDTERGSGNSSNVSIHFRLDDKTHDLTVFVVDRKTKRVIRSIPARELHKLQAGDLLKLTA
jgi:uncharacterized FlaG/YvyC family protein